LAIRLEPELFEPLQVLASWHEHLSIALGLLPAAESLFVGRVRPSCSSGEALQALELEHYPGMTERQLEQLAAAVSARHGVVAALVHHRVGLVRPGEAIVLIAIAADGRGPAQRCCQELLEALKHEAPFWKREWRGEGDGDWLAGNTPL
jgi:molybdopterin synthase catalytic subunit